MAFLAPLLSAGVSGLGIMGQMGAQSDANNINWSNLFETRRSNREAEKLQRSSRRDAYGNLLKYTPGVGWEIDTTPMTAAILGGQQKEQLESLTKDAPRNRAAAERMDKRSIKGDEAFDEAFNKFRYRPQRSEDVDVSDATNELLSARKKGLDESSAMLARQLIRTGGSSELSNVYKTANDQYAQTLADAMLQGKSIGRQRHQQSIRDDLSGPGAELQLLKGIADGTTNSNIQNPGIGEELTGRADTALQQMVQALRQSQGAESAASGRLANSVSQSPDLSGLAAALGRLSFGGSAAAKDDDEQTWAEANAGGSW